MVQHGQADHAIEAGIRNLERRRILLEHSHIRSSHTASQRSRKRKVNLDRCQPLDSAPQQVGRQARSRSRSPAPRPQAALARRPTERYPVPGSASIFPNGKECDGSDSQTHLQADSPHRIEPLSTQPAHQASRGSALERSRIPRRLAISSPRDSFSASDNAARAIAKISVSSTTRWCS